MDMGMGVMSLILLILGVSSVETTEAEVTEIKENNAVVQIIAAATAKKMMDAGNVIILDVREQDEFDAGHIAGAVLIPYTEIAVRAGESLPEKDAVILVYCRSGRRSNIAANELVSMGYKNIYDFGGIIDWPYEIVK